MDNTENPNNTTVNQGDIFWVSSAGSRDRDTTYAHPYVIIQDDVINHSRIETVAACALSSNLNRAKEPGNVLLDEKEAHLPSHSVVVVSQVETIDKAALGAYIGSLNHRRIQQIFTGMRFLQRTFFK